MFYYRRVSGGEHPAHWQDHCLDFWSPQLCFSFPLNPGPAAEEMTIRGKTTKINNISSHLLTLPTRSLIFPPKHVFFCTFGCSTYHPTSQSALLLVSSTGLRPLTHEIYTSLSCTNSGGSHTCRFSFSPPFPLWTPSFLMRKESGLCSATSSPQWLASLGVWTNRTPPNFWCYSFVA